MKQKLFADSYDYILDKVSDKIKEIIDIEIFDGTKVLWPITTQQLEKEGSKLK